MSKCQIRANWSIDDLFLFPDLFELTYVTYKLSKQYTLSADTINFLVLRPSRKKFTKKIFDWYMARHWEIKQKLWNQLNLFIHEHIFVQGKNTNNGTQITIKRIEDVVFLQWRWKNKSQWIQLSMGINPTLRTVKIISSFCNEIAKMREREC